MPYEIICIVVGYLFGCFSTGYVVGKMNDVDIRAHGSGNIGATNALRTMGAKGGAITLLGDVLKALIPVLCVKYFLKDAQQGVNFLALLTGLGVVLGHNFPFWLKFKGGKGIAAVGGVLLAFDWKIALVLLSIFIIIVLITKYVSLGSLIGISGLPIGLFICYPGQIKLLVVGILLTLLAYIRHSSNIVRLIHGTENKIGTKKST